MAMVRGCMFLLRPTQLPPPLRGAPTASVLRKRRHRVMLATWMRRRTSALPRPMQVPLISCVSTTWGCGEAQPTAMLRGCMLLLHPAQLLSLGASSASDLAMRMRHRTSALHHPALVPRLSWVLFTWGSARPRRYLSDFLDCQTSCRSAELLEGWLPRRSSQRRRCRASARGKPQLRHPTADRRRDPHHRTSPGWGAPSAASAWRMKDLCQHPWPRIEALGSSQR
mmetsp:Transcript_51470/g.166937  ORF Transcript_51470/g.166937 Transcript_51470/m.166937 type:complete len:225 (+) Transcript_51470:1980-2654(+)